MGILKRYLVYSSIWFISLYSPVGQAIWIPAKVEPALQAQIQEYFDSIYEKIRLPEDPAKPPKVVLVKTVEFRAAVHPNDSSQILWNIDHVLGAESEDILAGTYAHELTHFEAGQLARTKEKGRTASTFANEIEAQSRGILRRIARIDEKDPVTRQPAAARYSLEAIIEDYEADNTFRNDYANYQNVASALKVFFARDRYKRPYPKESTPTKQFAYLEELSKSIPYTQDKEVEPRSAVREEIHELMKLYSKDLPTQFSMLAKRFDAVPQDATEDRAALARQIAVIWPELPFRTYDEPRPAEVAAIDRVLASISPRFFEEVSTVLGDQTPYEFNAFVRLNQFFADPKAYSLRLHELEHNGPVYSRYLASKILTHEKEIFSEPDDPSLNRLVLLTYLEQRPRYQEPRLKALQAHATQALDALPSSLLASPEILHRLGYNRAARSLIKLPLPQLIELDRAFEPLLRSSVARARKDFATFVMGDLAEKGKVWELLRFESEDIAHDYSDAQLDALLVKALAENQKILDPLLKKIEVPAYQTKLLTQLAARAKKLEKSHPLIAKKYFPLFTALSEQPLSAGQFAGAVEGFSRSLDASRIHESWDLSSDYRKQVGLDARIWQDFYSPRERSAIKLSKRYPGFMKALDQHIEAHLPGFLVVAASDIPSENYTFPQEMPFARAIGNATPLDILSLATLPGVADSWFERANKDVHSSNENERDSAKNIIKFGEQRRGHFYDLLMTRLGHLVTQSELTDEAAAAAIRGLSFLPGAAAHPAMGRLLATVETRMAKEPDLARRIRYLSSISPHSYTSASDYTAMVARAVAPFGQQIGKLALNDPTRGPAIRDLVSTLRSGLEHIDTPLRQLVMDDLAAKIRAVPAEKDFLTEPRGHLEAPLMKFAEYANAISEAYSNFKPDQKWDFLQWVRGKNPELTPDILLTIRLGLARHAIYLPLNQIEPYVRQRFDAMSPSARAVFFQIALEGSSGLLKSRRHRNKITGEIYQNLPAKVAATVHQLHRAAVNALPKSYKNVILATAYAESGKHGSPEQAFRLLLSRMGALVQKLGQNLAFIGVLPKSYRDELKKLWDEGERPGWWKTYDLLEDQFPGTKAAGFRMIAIRNAGSTEIAVELEDTQGQRYITGVQREALRHGASVDAEDLERFNRDLISRLGGKRKYGFLPLLLEDSKRTMAMEADPKHKMRMTPLMRDAYREAVERLGGQVTGQKALYQGWSIESPKFQAHKLSSGEELITQEVAPGVPLKDLEASDPKLYRQLSEYLIAIEHEAQKDPSRPIDKDRMPGQVLVDVANRIVTLLDHGQAKKINEKAHRARDPFIANTLALNVPEVAKIGNDLGLKLGFLQQVQLANNLRNVDAEFRPLHALSWIYERGLTSKMKDPELFWDLVHAVRAQSRLAQWGESLGVTQVQDQWRSHAMKANPLPSVLDRCLQAILKLKRK